MASREASDVADGRKTTSSAFGSTSSQIESNVHYIGINNAMRVTWVNRVTRLSLPSGS